VIAAAGVLLVVALVALAVHRHRRQVWARTFADTRNEVRWVARMLVPQLALEPTTAQMMQDWQPASARVMAAEDRLAQLETTAPDASRAARVRNLRDALVSARIRVNDLVASPNAPVARAGLTSIAAALDATESSLDQPPAAPQGGQGR
jgi:hypothetical protein